MMMDYSSDESTDADIVDISDIIDTQPLPATPPAVVATVVTPPLPSQPPTAAAVTVSPTTATDIHPQEPEDTWEDTLATILKSIKFDKDSKFKGTIEDLEVRALVLSSDETAVDAKGVPVKDPPLSAQTTFLLKRAFPTLIDAILRRGDVSGECADAVKELLKTLTRGLARYTHSDVIEVFQVLAAIFDPKRVFVERFSRGTAPQITIDCLNEYYHAKGFIAMQNKMADFERRLTLEEIRLVVHPMAMVRQWLISPFVEDWTESIAPSLHHRIEMLCPSAESLKNERPECVRDIIKDSGIVFRNTKGPHAVEHLEKMILFFAEKLLKCQQLEKRFAGLKEIAELCQDVLMLKASSAAYAHHNSNKHFVTSSTLAAWSAESQVVECLFRSDTHVELIRRSTDLIQMMAREKVITDAHLDTIWSTAGHGCHETVQLAIYTLLGDISMWLEPLRWNHVVEKLVTLPQKSFNGNKPLLNLLLAYHDSINAAPPMTSIDMIDDKDDLKPMTTTTTTAAMSEQQKAVAEVLWGLGQDESEVSVDIAWDSLRHMARHLSQEPIRRAAAMEEYMLRALQNVQQHKSVPQSLSFLLQLHGIKSKVKHNAEAKQAFEKMNKQMPLMPLLIADLKHLFASEPLTPKGLKYEYEEQVKQRIEFMDIMLINSPSIKLALEDLEALWDMLVDKAPLPSTREAAFDLFINLGYCAAGEVRPLSDELAKILFTVKFEQLNVSDLNDKEFNFFDYFFRYLNWRENKITDWKAACLDPIGLSVLWKLALEVKTDSVGKTALANLLKLIQNATTAEIQQGFRESFLNRCVAVVSSESATELAVVRSLTLMKTILLEEQINDGVFENRHDHRCHGVAWSITCSTVPSEKEKERLIASVSVYSNDTIGVLRQKIAEQFKWTETGFKMVVGGEVVESDDSDSVLSTPKMANGCYVFVHVPRKDGVVWSPKQKKKRNTTNGNNSNVMKGVMAEEKTYKVLFDLIQKTTTGGVIGELAYDVLKIMPTDPHLLSHIDELLSLEKTTSSNNNNNARVLMYHLTIIESFAENAKEKDDKEEQAKREEWKKMFETKHDGCNKLVSLLLSVDEKQDKQFVCQLTRVVSYFHLHTTDNDNKTAVVVVKKLMSIIQQSAEQQQHSDSTDTEISSNSMAIIKQLPSSTTTSIIFDAITTPTAALRQWIQCTLLTSSNRSMSDVIASSLYDLVAGAPLQSHHQSTLLHLLVGFIVTGDVLTASCVLDNCSAFFSLVIKLMQNKTEKVDDDELLIKCVTMIEERPIVETRNHPKEDKVLQGLLQLTHTLLLHHHHHSAAAEATAICDRIGQQQGLVEELLVNCLFSMPTVENHGGLSPPKCKTQETRKHCFTLLLDLCRHSSANSKLVRAKLLCMVSSEDVQKNTTWLYTPTAVEKAACGYSGLRNLGCTCYMNSVLQQLNMHPQFKSAILQAKKQTTTPTPPVAEEKPGVTVVHEEKMLEELQTLFGFMQESEKKAQDTRAFVSTLKHEGQPVNPMIQMDAEEFLAQLFDKLETQLKGSGYDNIIKDCFGGTVCHQLIPSGCDHKKEREESFLTLQMVVQNKKDLMESLREFVAGELLSGDNQFMCEECKVKRDTLKRACIDKLPATLFIHCKRFEFDLEWMRRIKVNDEYTFPMKFNIEPFTRSGIQKSEGSVTPTPNQQCCDYELVGVIIHLGTADSGHYYSYIRERTEAGKWFCFNDSSVDQWNTDRMANDCFGGSEMITTANNSISSQQKMYNAYMLVYQRADVPSATSAVVPTTVPNEIYNRVWEENIKLFSDKYLYDTDLCSFIWDLLRSEAAVAVTEETIELGTRLVFDVMARSRDHPKIKEFTVELKQMYLQNPRFTQALFTRCCHAETRWIRQLLLDCPAEDVREAVADLFSSLLLNVWSEEFLEYYVSLIKEVAVYWKTFTQYFLVIATLARNGGRQAQQFLLSHHVVASLVDLYLGDASPVKSPNKKRVKLGDKFAIANVSHLVSAVVSLVKSCEEDKSLVVPEEDASLMKCLEFYNKAIKEGMNASAAMEVLTLLCANNNKATSESVLASIASAVSDYKAIGFRVSLQSVLPVLAIKDDLLQFRVDLFLKKFFEATFLNIKFEEETLECVKFLTTTLCPASPESCTWLWKNKEQWLQALLVVCSHDTVRSETLELFKMLVVSEKQPICDVLSYLVSMHAVLQKHVVKRGLQWCRALNWCVLQSQKQESTKQDLIRLYAVINEPIEELLWLCNTIHSDLDWPKHELTVFVSSMLAESEDNFKAFVANDLAQTSLLAWHMTIKPEEESYIAFNNASFPVYFSLVERCCNASEKWTKAYANHGHLSWAIRELVIRYSSSFPVVSATLLRILSHIVEVCPAEVKDKYCEILFEVAGDWWRLAPVNCLRFLSLLVTGPEDLTLFLKHDGWSQLATAFRLGIIRITETPDLLSLCYTTLTQLITIDHQAHRLVKDAHGGMKEMLGCVCIGFKAAPQLVDQGMALLHTIAPLLSHEQVLQAVVEGLTPKDSALAVGAKHHELFLTWARDDAIKSLPSCASGALSVLFALIQLGDMSLIPTCSASLSSFKGATAVAAATNMVGYYLLNWPGLDNNDLFGLCACVLPMLDNFFFQNREMFNLMATTSETLVKQLASGNGGVVTQDMVLRTLCLVRAVELLETVPKIKQIITGLDPLKTIKLNVIKATTLIPAINKPEAMLKSLQNISK